MRPATNGWRGSSPAGCGKALGQGTTWLETKTGYGLTVDDEVRGAVIAASEVGDATFLGAHLVPDGLDPDDYVDLVCGPMLAGVAPMSGGPTSSASRAPSPSSSRGGC